MLKFDRKQQNSVKQLSFNKKNKLKKKKECFHPVALCPTLSKNMAPFRNRGPQGGWGGGQEGWGRRIDPSLAYFYIRILL